MSPQFVAYALEDLRTDKLRQFLILDSDDMDRVLATIDMELDQAPCIVISKTGGTKETRNGKLFAKVVFYELGLDFGRHSIAVNSSDSELHDYVVANKWLTKFPMWDWFGERSSELSIADLFPTGLERFDIQVLSIDASKYDEYRAINNVKLNESL